VFLGRKVQGPRVGCHWRAFAEVAFERKVDRFGSSIAPKSRLRCGALTKSASGRVRRRRPWWRWVEAS
jgi:hypothetical protein